MRKFKVVKIEEVTTSTGSKFTAFKVAAKGGRLMDLRFRKTAKNVPTEPCTICVEDNQCNVDTTRQYPILWVSTVESIERTERKNNTADFFD